MPKQDLYKGIKTVGFVSFIPFILAAGPLSGYFIGLFLQQKLGLPDYTVFFAVGLGFLIAVSETVKLIKAIIRVYKK